MGGSATSTYTPTVIGTPTANPDTTTGDWKANQSINVVNNVTGNAGDDVAANGATLDATSVEISCANAVGCTETVDGNGVVTAVTIANQGTYTVDPATGEVTFDPLDTFTGEATPVTYTVSDNLGQTATSTYTPTVLPPAPPIADAETTAGSKGVPQTTDLLVGDSTSDPSISLVASSVKLCDPTTDPAQVSPNCTLTTLNVPGVGTYSVVNGVMTFTPEPNYVGTPTPVAYQVTDTLGAKASSTYTPTVVGAPTASPNTTTGGKGAPQEVSLIGNDSAATGATLDPTSVKLCDPNPTAEVAPDCTKTSVTVSGVGTYAVDSTGKMTFTPDANYVGTPPALSYTVTDSLGAKASSTYTPTVIGTPTAVADTSTGPQGVAQSRNVVTNTAGTSDSAASGTTLVSSTVTLSCASAPNCTRNIDGTVTIDGQGTYSAAAADGTVVFTPLPTFTGTATPVTYTVSDALGQSATTTYTPTVIPAPVAINDTSTNGQDKNQLIDVLNNDTVPTNPAGDPLNPASVKLCGTNPAETSPNCTLTTLTTADGTYTVNPTTGVVTFDPIPSFTGTVSVPVRYQVSDTGTTPQTTSATITPTVIPGPTALNDTSSGPMNTAQTKTLVTNDSAASDATLDVASVKLCDPNPTAEVAPNCTKTSVTVSGVGTYAVDSSGVMTFTPVTGYSGTPTPLSYTVEDNFDVKATATYTPTVIPPPTLVPDTSTGPWDTNQTRNVVTNNVNTSDSAAAGTTLADSSVRLCAPSDTAPNCTVTSGGSVVIANQGTYTIDPTTGIVTFDPLPTFTGTANPVTYSVTDALGQKSSTTYTPTVTVPPVPNATPDTVELLPGQSKVFSSIFDGQTGDTDPALATKGTGAPDLTNSSVCLLTPGTTTCDADGIVTIPGEGTYTLNATTGIVTYAALSSATPGVKTPVTYQITDGLGRSVTSTLTPTITPPPVANPDFSTGVQGAIQTLSPVGNDRPGGGASTELFPDTRAQVPSGIFLCAANQPPPDCAATTVDVFENNVKLGTLTVAATGLVTFTPEPNFVGTTPAIGYQLPDNLGQKAYSTITITVVPPPAPSAVIDTGSAEYNKPVTLKPWINDVAGSVPAGSTVPAPSLVATSIKLCGDNSTFIAMSTTPADCAATKVKTVEGTYEVNATTGEVTFTPNPNMIDPVTGLPTGKGFVGTVKYPPTYQIWNNYSGAGGVKSATALLVPTIAPPGAPAATVDITKTKPGTSVVLNPVSNDKPGTAALDPTTIRLCGTGEISPACTQMSVTTLDGLYVVEPTTGQVTFTPRDGFTGQATIPYIIMDGLGMMALSNLIITVEDTAVVPVAKKTKVGLAKTGGHRPDLLLLLGILAMVGAGGLRVMGRRS
jgi:CshA-type fibril repeat protein